MVSFKQTFTGEFSFPISLLEYPSCSHVPHSFINFSIYVCGLWSSFPSSLPSCTLLHSCFPVWTTHAPPYFGDCSPHSCSFHKTGLTWLFAQETSYYLLPHHTWDAHPSASSGPGCQIYSSTSLHSPSNSTFMVCLVGQSSLPSVKSGEINTGINLLGIFLFTFP